MRFAVSSMTLSGRAHANPWALHAPNQGPWADLAHAGRLPPVYVVQPDVLDVGFAPPAHPP